MTRAENAGHPAVATQPGPVSPAVPAPADAGLERAVRAGEVAARAAGVTVRELTVLDELEAAVALYADIWGRGDNPPLSLELLRAFGKAGNYVSGAFEGDRLVGACVGFFSAPAQDALHSHIAGVSRSALGHSIGFALKLHQRSWAMRRGVADVVWTFDPLVSRNAYFNLAKLAAETVEYLPNFYGPMSDTINGKDDSDRLLVRWRLRDEAVVAACAGRHAMIRVADELAAGAVVGLGIGEDGGPVAGRRDADTVLVGVPLDIEVLRLADPALAARWRLAVREALSTLLADGSRVVGFDRDGWYVVRRNP